MGLRDNGEQPIEDIKDLLSAYGYKSDEIEKARQELGFVKDLFKLKEEIEKNFSVNSDCGTVYSVQAPWGMGKTSFVKILLNEIKSSKTINTQNLCLYYYDSLYYGNVTEAIRTLLQQLFKKIEQQYALKLHNVSAKIAQNLSPSLEINGLFAKISLVRNFKTDDTSSLITTEIKDKLKSIKGKIIIVIDDVDRLTSGEALHLLRLVRVLKDIPNTLIILPIDYDALVNMLKEEKVSNPGGYVRKVITTPNRIFQSTSDWKIFFQKNFVSELNIENEEQAAPYIEDLWLGYLWELSLNSLHKYEVRNVSPFRIEMTQGRTDTVWQLADILNGRANSTNFVHSFFEKTRRDYGSTTDYLVKYAVVGNPDIFRYYRYNRIAPTITFDKFFKGTYDSGALGGGIEMLGGLDIFNMEVYAESDLIELTKKANNTEQENYQTTKEEAALVDAKKANLWDLFSGLILENFPDVALRHVSPRMIIRLIDELKIKKSEEIIEVMKSPKSATNNLYLATRDDIETFVDDYTYE